MTKILLVEDNELSRDMLSRRLRRRGFEVVTAEDGLVGVEASVRERPDLVLMDLDMPRVDGWEATRRIKANPATRDLPVVALTALSLPGERERAYAAGCDDFDTKPVNLARLLAKIYALLGSA